MSLSIYVTICFPTDGLDGFSLSALASLGDDLTVSSPHLQTCRTSGSCKELDAWIVGEKAIVGLGIQPGLPK